jgi:hypothetical protein
LHHRNPPPSRQSNRTQISAYIAIHRRTSSIEMRQVYRSESCDPAIHTGVSPGSPVNGSVAEQRDRRRISRDDAYMRRAKAAELLRFARELALSLAHLRETEARYYDHDWRREHKGDGYYPEHTLHDDTDEPGPPHRSRWPSWSS